MSIQKQWQYGVALACALVFLGQSATSAQEAGKVREAIPLSNTPSVADVSPRPMSFTQQQARYMAEQAMLRSEWYKWMGYSPLRPNTNSVYMNSGLYNFTPGMNYNVVYSSRHRFYGW